MNFVQRIPSYRISPVPPESDDWMPGCGRFENSPIEFMTGALALDGEVKEGLGTEIGLVPELGNHRRAAG